jgi:hypothetical protein
MANKNYLTLPTYHSQLRALNQFFQFVHHRIYLSSRVVFAKRKSHRYKIITFAQRTYHMGALVGAAAASATPRYANVVHVKRH